MKVGMREEMFGCRDLGEYGVCEGREKKNARYTIKKRKCKKRNRKKKIQHEIGNQRNRMGVIIMTEARGMNRMTSDDGHDDNGEDDRRLRLGITD